MIKKLELEGCRFGRLIVIGKDPERTKHRYVKWFCQCDCGVIKSIDAGSLRNGDSKSCGCLSREIISKRRSSHRLSNHPLYSVYVGMKTRCYNRNNEKYKNYGDRGIKVCDYWLEGFINFYNDMEGGYRKGVTIDRIDNDKGYSKENCRWVTPQQNSANSGFNINSTSQYKGVSWNKEATKWTAQATKMGKQYHLGTFTCEHEAAKAYNTKALELNGEYAYLNKIED